MQKHHWNHNSIKYQRTYELSGCVNVSTYGLNIYKYEKEKTYVHI